MAYVTIPQLPAGSSLTGLEQFEAVQASTSVKLTAQQIKSFISSSPSLSVEDTNLNGVSNAATLTHTVTGTPAIGIGTGLAFATETQVSTIVQGSQLASICTDNTIGSEDFDFVISTKFNGATTEYVRVTSTGRLGIGTTAPVAALDATVSDTTTNAISVAGAFTHATTTSPTTGIGVGVAFRTQTSIATLTTGAQIAAIATATALSSENFDLVFQLTTGGAVNQEVARFTSAKRLGINTSTPSTSLEVLREDASTSTVISAARFSRGATGLPLVGIGTAIELATETAASVYKVGGAIYTQSTTLTSGAEDFDLAFSVMQGGASSEVLRITSDRRVGINTTTPATAFQSVVDDNSINAVSPAARLTHTVVGVPANGVGTSLEFETEVQAGVNAVGASISAVTTDVSSGSEDFDLVFNTMAAGSAPTEKFRVASTSIIATAPFTKFGAGIAPTGAAYAEFQTNNSTIPPLQFSPTSPTLQTNPISGSMDYDGEALYFTPVTSQRGVIRAAQTYLNSAGTRAGPNQINTAQTATFTGSSSTITVTNVPGSVAGTTGALVIFGGTTAPSGITFGQPYWVNRLTATTMNVSSTQGGAAIVPTTAGSAVTATFYFPIVGNDVTSVGVNLQANTRYLYELFFVLSHTGTTPGATTVSYALTNQTGTLAAHGYRVEHYNSTAAISGNLTGVAMTSSGLVANYLTTNFSAHQVVTGATAATANTTNTLLIQGQIDTLTDITGLVPAIGFGVAPAASNASSIIYPGAYMSIYPIGPSAADTSIGSWSA